MKKFITLATLSLLSFSAFSGTTCSIAQDKNNDGNYTDQIALYKNIDTTSSQTITTLERKDGTVVKNFDLQDMFREIRTMEEYKAKRKELAGSTIYMIQPITEENQMALTISKIDDTKENFIVPESLAITQLDSKDLAVFNLKTRKTIYCVNQ